MTIRVLLRGLSTKTSAEEVYNDNKHLRLHANEAYSFVIQLRRNEAYETTGKPSVSQEDTGPHLYDEIPLPAYMHLLSFVCMNGVEMNQVRVSLQLHFYWYH